MSMRVSSARFDDRLEKAEMSVRGFCANHDHRLDKVDDLSTRTSPASLWDNRDDRSARLCQDRSEAPSLTRDSKGTTSSIMVTPINRTIITQRRTSAKDRYIAELKRRALREQRPHEPELLCCDYEAAEKAAAFGLPTNLCSECLGEEYMRTSEDL
ncbi:hypothetical protein VTN77DRAFT_4307 [Rasamsonia byssochlamydoides]|uniref:uncharacterized protein n=1 Tax=Rasamsonia byssochlamydoides TaxID=89139 RepID=UPI0037446107